MKKTSLNIHMSCQLLSDALLMSFIIKAIIVLLFALYFSHGFENLRRELLTSTQFLILVKYSCKSLFCLLPASSGGNSDFRVRERGNDKMFWCLQKQIGSLRKRRKKSDIFTTYFLNVHSNLRLFLPTRDLTFLTCSLYIAYKVGL